MNLYDISTEFTALEELLMMDGGEITESHQELETMILALLLSKADNMVNFIQKLEDESDLADAHIKRIQLYKKARVNAIERLKDYVKVSMDKMQKDKVEGAMGSISIRKPVKVVDILNEDLIPAEFTKVKVDLDKTKIAKALKDGQEIEGARLIDGKRSVQFKLKAVK